MASSFSLAGCLGGGVQVRDVAGGVAPPSNIAKVVVVSSNGAPVPALRNSAFRIIEDAQLLDGQSIDLHLLPPESTIAFHTVLLLDQSLSGTVEGRELLARATSGFVQKLHTRQSVTVLTFDGSPKSRILGSFPLDPTGGKIDITPSRFAPPTDPSRNLRGAILGGLTRLETMNKLATLPVQVDNLVVFSLGPDIANRSPQSEVTERLTGSRVQRYFVGLAGDLSDIKANGLDENGKATSPDTAHLPEAFDNIADQLIANSGSYYVVSYCTPARSGKRRLRLEVDVISDDLEVQTGAVESEFDATGFTAGCAGAKFPRMSLIKAVSTR